MCDLGTLIKLISSLCFSNQMSVCLGDKVNLTCPGSDSTVIYSNSESHYNNCTYDGTCNFGNSGDPYKFGKLFRQS